MKLTVLGVANFHLSKLQVYLRYNVIQKICFFLRHIPEFNLLTLKPWFIISKDLSRNDYVYITALTNTFYLFVPSVFKRAIECDD